MPQNPTLPPKWPRSGVTFHFLLKMPVRLLLLVLAGVLARMLPTVAKEQFRRKSFPLKAGSLVHSVAYVELAVL